MLPLPAPLRRWVGGLAPGRGPGSLYRKWASLRFLATRDRAEVLRFLTACHPAMTRADKFRLVWRFYHTTNHIRAYHAQAELLRVASAIIERAGHGRPLVVVEAGAGKGASTAKLSLALRAAGGGTLHVFDSFRGIPDNDEVHQHLDGRRTRFRKGAFTGRLSGVKRTVARFGAPELCVYHKGWFEETMPQFAEEIDVVLLDVDLWSSTRTCLRYLYPRLRPGGVLFSQDGHLLTIAKELGRSAFWEDQIGVRLPPIRGLGREKLLEISPSVPSRVRSKLGLSSASVDVGRKG